MHDNNQRVTRTHATPWNEAWLDAADEIGLGVSVEGIRPWAFVGKIGATPKDLFEHWLMENADVVRRIRNHPSVLIWTIGNEMLLRVASSCLVCRTTVGKLFPFFDVFVVAQQHFVADCPD